MPERIFYHLEEIHSCAAAVLRISPRGRVAHMATQVCQAAATLSANPWDEEHKAALAQAVSTLGFALEEALED